MTQKPDTVELLPCPFCGSDDVQVYWYLPDISSVQEEDFGDGSDGPESAMYSIECKGCRFDTDSYASAQIIAKIWNTRDTAERDKYRDACERLIGEYGDRDNWGDESGHKSGHNDIFSVRPDENGYDFARQVKAELEGETTSILPDATP